MLASKLHEWQQRGINFQLQGDSIKVLAPKPVMTPSLLQEVKSCKSELIDYLKKNQDLSSDTVIYWRERYEERAAIREFDGELDRKSAEIAALHEMVDLWIIDNSPQRVSNQHCVSCGAKLGKHGWGTSGNVWFCYTGEATNCFEPYLESRRKESRNMLASYGVGTPPQREVH